MYFIANLYLPSLIKTTLINNLAILLLTNIATISCPRKLQLTGCLMSRRSTSLAGSGNHIVHHFIYVQLHIDMCFRLTATASSSEATASRQRRTLSGGWRRSALVGGGWRKIRAGGRCCRRWEYSRWWRWTVARRQRRWSVAVRLAARACVWLAARRLVVPSLHLQLAEYLQLQLQPEHSLK